MLPRPIKSGQLNALGKNHSSGMDGGNLAFIDGLENFQPHSWLLELLSIFLGLSNLGKPRISSMREL